MKVKDLIKQLQKMPQDIEVKCYDNGWRPFSIKVRENPPVSLWFPKGEKLHDTIVALTADY
jgi:hypothetical protein